MSKLLTELTGQMSLDFAAKGQTCGHREPREGAVPGILVITTDHYPWWRPFGHRTTHLMLKAGEAYSIKAYGKRSGRTWYEVLLPTKQGKEYRVWTHGKYSRRVIGGWDAAHRLIHRVQSRVQSEEQ